MVIQVTAIHLFYSMKNEANKRSKKKANQGLNTEAELKKLGKRIKQLRIDKGYSSYEYFAYDNNISRAQFGRYEKGQDLRFSSLIKVIAAFEMSVSDFFAEGLD